MSDKKDSDKNASEFEDHSDETVADPTLDCADDHTETRIDPRKGMTDPALIRDIESGKKIVNPYG